MRTVRFVLGACLAAALAAGGCNLFSWTHEAGSSDDPRTLLQDAEDALLAGDYDRALAYADRGIQRDPNVAVPKLRHIAARAVLGRNGISIASYLNAFTSKPDSRPGLATEILDLSPEELARLADACPRGAAYLQQILDALARGTIGPEDLEGYRFDVHVGYGVLRLLEAFVTILDDGQNLGDGFQPSTLVSIEADETGGYRLVYKGPDPDQFARDVLFCPQRCRFRDALEGIYDAYRDASGLAQPRDLWTSEGTPGPLPDPIDPDLLIGTVLRFTHAGVSALFVRYGCPCTAGDAG